MPDGPGADPPDLEALAAAWREASEALRQKYFQQAAGIVRGQVVPAVRQLEASGPQGRRSAVKWRNRAAVTLNNCALGLLDRPLGGEVNVAIEWLSTARRLATDAATETLIAETLEFYRVAQLDQARRRVRSDTRRRQGDPDHLVLDADRRPRRSLLATLWRWIRRRLRLVGRNS